MAISLLNAGPATVVAEPSDIPSQSALDKMWEFQLSGPNSGTAKARGRVIGVSGNIAMVYCILADASNEWSAYTDLYLFSMTIDFSSGAYASDAYAILSGATDGSTFSNVVATLYFADAVGIIAHDIPSKTEIVYDTVVFKEVST